MPPVAHVPAQLRGRPFLGSKAIAAGMLTREQLRSSVWRRIGRDVYVEARVPDGLILRAHAAGLVLPPGAAVGGAAALALLAPECAPNQTEVDVLVPPTSSFRGRRGMTARQAILEPADVCVVNGICVTSPVRTVFDICRSVELVDAVVLLDAVSRYGLTGPEAVSSYARARGGWRGVRRAMRACELCDPGAESPMETRLRLVLVLAGLPRPVTQFEVLGDDGRLVGRLDLGYPEVRLGVEYDGDQHRELRAHTADMRRQNALARAGWLVLRYAAGDVFRRPELIVAQVRGALDDRVV